MTGTAILLSSCFVNNSSPIGAQGGFLSEGKEPQSQSDGTGGGRDQPETEEGLSSDAASLLAVEILSNNPGYTLKRLRKDNLVFVDRPYYFPDTGPYDGYCALQTAMEDKREEGADFLHFTVSRATTVYVGYDTRWPIPAWLSDWVDTGESLVMADDNARYWPYLGLRLFRKTFPEGHVELGGNGGAGSMYIVLLDSGGEGCTLKNDRRVELHWYPNDDEVDGYRIYVKKDAGLVPFRSVGVTELPDPQNPSMTFRSWSDLGLTGENVCFSVSAYRGDTESDLSRLECNQ